MRLDLVRPCPHCPFRTDIEGYLRPARAAEIAGSLLNGGSFPCHKTVNYDDDGDPITGDQFCAGALIAMEREGLAPQLARTMERLGGYDASRLDMDAPVGTLLDFQRHHDDRDEEMECCHVAEMGCEAPAGYAVGGGIALNVVEVEIPNCEGCGEPTCESCGRLVDGTFLCLVCLDYEEA